MNIVKNFNLCCLFLKSIIAIKKLINKYNNEQQQKQKKTTDRRTNNTRKDEKIQKYNEMKNIVGIK